MLFSDVGDGVRRARFVRPSGESPTNTLRTTATAAVEDQSSLSLLRGLGGCGPDTMYRYPFHEGGCLRTAPASIYVCVYICKDRFGYPFNDGGILRPLPHVCSVCIYIHIYQYDLYSECNPLPLGGGGSSSDSNPYLLRCPCSNLYLVVAVRTW